MQQRANVAIDDDDDDSDVEQDAAETVEKFVQTRHVQTLKYLQRVIDENRHLRLHVEHLKENPTDSVVPTAVVTRPKVNSHSRASLVDVATNTNGDDLEAKCRDLTDEIVNLKKQHQINRGEFQRELKRVDEQNVRLEKDFNSVRRQLLDVEERDHEKNVEVQSLTSLLTEYKLSSEAVPRRVNNDEQTNQLLTDSLSQAEGIRLALVAQLDERAVQLRQSEERLAKLEADCRAHRQASDNEIQSLTHQLHLRLARFEEVQDDNRQLSEVINDLQRQLEEKAIQEEIHARELRLNSNFKEFIQVKRTLQGCQQENEQLKNELIKVQRKLLNKP